MTVVAMVDDVQARPATHEKTIGNTVGSGSPENVDILTLAAKDPLTAIRLREAYSMRRRECEKVRISEQIASSHLSYLIVFPTDLIRPNLFLSQLLLAGWEGVRDNDPSRLGFQSVFIASDVEGVRHKVVIRLVWLWSDNGLADGQDRP